MPEMRSAEQVEKLMEVALRQEKVSRARDYWQGVIDGLDYALGGLPDSVHAHLMATAVAEANEAARRDVTEEHMRQWAAGEHTHPGEEDERG